MTASQLPLPFRVQRWRSRRECWRPAGELVRPERYGVDEITEDEARQFVVAHHYSGSYVADRIRVGLHEAGVGLVGVAVFSIGGPHTLGAYIAGASKRNAVELGRFVMLDQVPGNAESWYLGRCWRLIRDRYPWVRWVLSMSDPLPRERADGTLLTPGHVGVIYQAHNGQHVGRSRARWRRIGPDGREFADRALQKLRAGDKGRAYASRQLLEAGAPAPYPGESGESYADRVLSLPLFRRVWHPGNYVYTWAVRDRRDLAACAPALPYPARRRAA